MSFGFSIFYVTIICYLNSLNGEIFFHEDFKNGLDDWIQPESSTKTYGKIQKVEFPGSNPVHYGIETTYPSHFYAAVKKFPMEISTVNQDLSYVLGLKASSSKGCGGNYIKILPQLEDLKSFHAESPYNIMFGPDKCGSKNVIHVIINHNNVNHELKVPIQHTFTDYYQIFRLDILKDRKFRVFVDDKEVHSGSLLTDFDIIPPKEIDDPSVSKPTEWDDRLKIEDPNDKKPSDWDKPEYIPDPNAVKPADWNDDDGEWIPENIRNPEFKGDWHPKLIDNPNYQGEWVHPKIDNPAYNEELEKTVGHFTHSSIAIDWWEVESGDVVSDFIVGTTDSVEKLTNSLIDQAKEFKKYQDQQKQQQEKEEKKFDKDDSDNNNADTEAAPDHEDDATHEGHDHDHNHEQADEL